MKDTLMITGGAGFIGSHLVRRFVNLYPEKKIINLDALTYAGNLANLRDVEGCENYVFEKADITNPDEIRNIFKKHKPAGLIHLAAESHVDRSILNPLDFVKTNVLGTVNLLNAAKAYWEENNKSSFLFYHISTDEVYGSLGASGYFTEKTRYDPHSPYSASKASSDHFVRAYFDTFGLPVILSNCSNNYGPNQFPEKLIPLVIHNIKNNLPIPVYGKGENVRDWLYVEDHAQAIDLIFHEGKPGETYNVGGHNEWKNIDLVKTLCQIMDSKLSRPRGTSEKLIQFVQDRAGHDLRYSIDASKLKKDLGWQATTGVEDGLEKTVGWYLTNGQWLAEVTTGAYREFYAAQYGSR